MRPASVRTPNAACGGARSSASDRAPSADDTRSPSREARRVGRPLCCAQQSVQDGRALAVGSIAISYGQFRRKYERERRTRAGGARGGRAVTRRDFIVCECLMCSLSRHRAVPRTIDVSRTRHGRSNRHDDRPRERGGQARSILRAGKMATVAAGAGRVRERSDFIYVCAHDLFCTWTSMLYLSIMILSCYKLNKRRQDAHLPVLLAIVRDALLGEAIAQLLGLARQLPWPVHDGQHRKRREEALGLVAELREH